ncbi:hypothetical protein ABH903_001726 [Brevibacterium epidermidis]|jgi:hypothetical protein|uniref:PucR family transcriptional regulator n=1 Tax=Brevibacterium epidermidis TaxID=1698 RepID=A0ABV4EJM8_BREEP
MAETQKHLSDEGHVTEVELYTSRMAAQMRPHITEFTALVYDYLAARITELSKETALLELLRASIESNVETIFDALEQRLSPDHLRPPQAAFDYAKTLAQRGISVNALVRAYRLGQQRLLQRVYEVVIADDELPPQLVTAVFQFQVDEVSDYIDWISQKVADHYEVERESWLANRATARETQVRRIIDGDDVDPSSAERILGYGLSARHIGVIAWTPPGTDLTSDQLGRFTAAIRALGQALGTKRPVLIIGRDQNTAWGWISVPDDWSFNSALLAGFADSAATGISGSLAARHGSVQLAIGSAHPLTAGFRLSHQEAVRVQQVSIAGSCDAPLVSHDQWGMSVVSLLAGDLEATRTWARSVLGPIAEDTEANARHRRTLREFLRHDLSYTATAAAMLMHKNSIRYRIEMAEAELGTTVTADRLAIETALCAHHHLIPTEH